MRAGAIEVARKLAGPVHAQPQRLARLDGVDERRGGQRSIVRVLIVGRDEAEVLRQVASSLPSALTMVSLRDVGVTEVVGAARRRTDRRRPGGAASATSSWCCGTRSNTDAAGSNRRRSALVVPGDELAAGERARRRIERDVDVVVGGPRRHAGRQRRTGRPGGCGLAGAGRCRGQLGACEPSSGEGMCRTAASSAASAAPPRRTCRRSRFLSATSVHRNPSRGGGKVDDRDIILDSYGD